MSAAFGGDCSHASVGHVHSMPSVRARTDAVRTLSAVAEVSGAVLNIRTSVGARSIPSPRAPSCSEARKRPASHCLPEFGGCPSTSNSARSPVKSDGRRFSPRHLQHEGRR